MTTEYSVTVAVHIQIYLILFTCEKGNIGFFFLSILFSFDFFLLFFLFSFLFFFLETSETNKIL